MKILENILKFKYWWPWTIKVVEISTYKPKFEMNPVKYFSVLCYSYLTKSAQKYIFQIWSVQKAPVETVQKSLWNTK